MKPIILITIATLLGLGVSAGIALGTTLSPLALPATLGIGAGAGLLLGLGAALLTRRAKAPTQELEVKPSPQLLSPAPKQATSQSAPQTSKPKAQEQEATQAQQPQVSFNELLGAFGASDEAPSKPAPPAKPKEAAKEQSHTPAGLSLPVVDHIQINHRDMFASFDEPDLHAPPPTRAKASPDAPKPYVPSFGSLLINLGEVKKQGEAEAQQAQEEEAFEPLEPVQEEQGLGAALSFGTFVGSLGGEKEPAKPEPPRITKQSRERVKPAPQAPAPASEPAPVLFSEPKALPKLSTAQPSRRSQDSQDNIPIQRKTGPALEQAPNTMDGSWAFDMDQDHTPPASQTQLGPPNTPNQVEAPRVLEHVASRSPFGALSGDAKPAPQSAPKPLEVRGQREHTSMSLDQFGAFFEQQGMGVPPLELAQQPSPHAITRPGQEAAKFTRSTERTSKHAKLMGKLALSLSQEEPSEPQELGHKPTRDVYEDPAPPQAGIIKHSALKGLTLQRHSMTPQRPVPNQVMQMSMRSSIREEPQIMSEDAIQRLYREFLFALRSCGKSTMVDYDAFAAKVRDRRAKVRQRHNVRELQMAVAIKDGKASIEIRPR